MNDHYYTQEPASASRPVECEWTYRGEELRFTTDAGVFSRGEVDTGTRLLLEALPEEMQGEILDLGCGGREPAGPGAEPGKRKKKPRRRGLRGKRRHGGLHGEGL